MLKEVPRPERDVETISTLQRRFQRERTTGERLAGFTVQGAGSMAFVVAHFLWFAAWIPVNLNLIPGVPAFDPFPFSFLSLVVSLEAIFLALLVLIAQNTLTKEADRRALLDLQINLLAERESTKTLALLRRISRRLGTEDGDEEAERLAANTNVEELAEALENGS
ncbi:MAG TPA: DUF1003 domain-containing protein [Vicinamibacteria bacterium]|nr:DUF1003 domain-containing protein [Vicinamibacteria bacterium]